MLRLAFIVSLLTVPLAATVTADGDQGRLAFEILMNGESESPAVVGTTAEAQFSIQSDFGIGKAVIRRKNDSWPAKVVLRLHLKGLENFRVSDGSVTIGASASSPPSRDYRVWNEADEKIALTNKDAYWIKIKHHLAPSKEESNPKDVERDSDSGRSNVTSFFQLELPAALFKNNPQTIQLRWIDFYRN